MTDSALPSNATRERIRQVAENLYVLRGHDGFSFGDIAAAVGTTRANIHHHFGNKRELMRELVQGFTTNAVERIAGIWELPRQPFVHCMRMQVQDLRRFYDRFNPDEGSRNVWSPIARIRLDLPALGELAESALEQVNAAYDRSLRHALCRAIDAGELRPDTEIGDVARILRSTFLSCAPMTQDSGRFADVEQLLNSLSRTIVAAWGS
jgi:AcrR family transcriptional regulator